MQSLRPTPAEIARLEEAVARDFETTLETIRQGLESPGSALVLSLLGDVCRDNGVGTLFRAWSCVLRNSHESALDHLLSVLGVIEGHYEGDFLLPLREFLKACVSAVDAEQLTNLLAWSYERQVTTAGMALWNPASMEGAALHPQAQNWLDILARLGAEFEGTSLFQLSHLNSELARALIELESDCPRPERDLLQAVVSEWRQILETETEAMMGGVSV